MKKVLSVVVMLSLALAPTCANVACADDHIPAKTEQSADNAGEKAKSNWLLTAVKVYGGIWVISVIAATGFWIKHIKSAEMPKPYQSKYSRIAAANDVSLVKLMNVKK